VPRNGFNPIWDEEAQFSINIPDLAILEFKVVGHGVSDSFVPRLAYLLSFGHNPGILIF